MGKMKRGGSGNLKGSRWVLERVASGCKSGGLLIFILVLYFSKSTLTHTDSLCRNSSGLSWSKLSFIQNKSSLIVPKND
jgi:hypothetical protein